MTFEYSCPEGHITEKFFSSISAADAGKAAPVNCTVCKEQATLVEFSRTLEPHFYSGGFHKNSPTKRHSWKLVSKTEGNRNSAG